MPLVLLSRSSLRRRPLRRRPLGARVVRDALVVKFTSCTYSKKLMNLDGKVKPPKLRVSGILERAMNIAQSLTQAQVAYFIVVAAIVAAVLVALGLYLGLRLGKSAGRLEAERDLPGRLAAERGDAVKRSRAVLGGLASEQLAPYLPGFPFDPTEVRFIGKPVDFVAFVGSASGKIEEVAFVEVKSGNASLTPVERSLRDAVKEGRVSWVEYRAP
jgi:hypothetical protein